VGRDRRHPAAPGERPILDPVHEIVDGGFRREALLQFIGQGRVVTEVAGRQVGLIEQFWAPLLQHPGRAGGIGHRGIGMGGQRDGERAGPGVHGQERAAFGLVRPGEKLAGKLRTERAADHGPQAGMERDRVGRMRWPQREPDLVEAGRFGPGADGDQGHGLFRRQRDRRGRRPAEGRHFDRGGPLPGRPRDVDPGGLDRRSEAADAGDDQRGGQMAGEVHGGARQRAAV
jgi:hypothetical protein